MSSPDTPPAPPVATTAGRADFVIPAEHPAFAGHFPGHPVVPGVVLLDRALVLLRQAGMGTARRLLHAKFTAPIGPGEPVVLEWRLPAPGRVAFRGRCRGRVAFAGEAELAQDAGPIA